MIILPIEREGKGGAPHRMGHEPAPPRRGGAQHVRVVLEVRRREGVSSKAARGSVKPDQSGKPRATHCHIGTAQHGAGRWPQPRENGWGVVAIRDGLVGHVRVVAHAAKPEHAVHARLQLDGLVEGDGGGATVEGGVGGVIQMSADITRIVTHVTDDLEAAQIARRIRRRGRGARDAAGRGGDGGRAAEAGAAAAQGDGGEPLPCTQHVGVAQTPAVRSESLKVQGRVPTLRLLLCLRFKVLLQSPASGRLDSYRSLGVAAVTDTSWIARGAWKPIRIQCGGAVVEAASAAEHLRPPQAIRPAKGEADRRELRSCTCGRVGIE